MSLEIQLSPAKIPKDANVLAVCANAIKRSVQLVGILQEHDYQHIDHTGVYIPDQDEVRKKAAWADYIVCLDINAPRKLEELGAIAEHHIVLEFDVNEWASSGNGDYKSLGELYEEIKRLIAPYLED